MPQPTAPRTRYAIIGTGARAEMYVKALTGPFAGTHVLAAFLDSNPLRMRAHNRWLREAGVPPVPAYPPDRFAQMLDRERIDAVLVASVDRTHDGYLAAALDAGRAAVTEKPMAMDVPGCRRILDAVRRTGRQVRVTFNYRYSPVHGRVRELLADGVVGEVASVHFEWLLDVRHGADYFRRWHRDKAQSGGLLVHKACHHFDLVNWWLDAAPERVYAAGRLFFYGAEGGARHGYSRDYTRAHGAASAAGDPFALDLTANPRLRELYLDAEAADGYLRDRNVFGPGVSIEDDMAVLVHYSTGATMSYHLTAYAPWEGYRVAFNGSRGRLEVEVVENDHVSPGTANEVKGAQLHGVEASAEHGGITVTVRPFWRPPYRVPVPGHRRTGHGGGDELMLADLFGTGDRPSPQAATERDGALAVLTGLAANESVRTGAAVRTADLLEVP